MREHPNRLVWRARSVLLERGVDWQTVKAMAPQELIATAFLDKRKGRR